MVDQVQGKELGTRIKTLRVAKGIRRADAALEAGLSYDYMAKIENGQRNPNIEVLGRVLNAIGTDIEEFFGSGLSDLAPPQHGAPFPIEEWGLMKLGGAKAVPVVGWTQAGALTAALSEETQGAGEAVWSDSVPAGCFALKIEGDSMEPEFSAGDVIIVDPRLAPQQWDYVVAQIGCESEAVFKQYLVKKGRVFLHALNPKYPDISLDKKLETVVVGVVVESKRIFTKPERRAEIMSKIIAQLAEMTDDELEKMAERLKKA